MSPILKILSSLHIVKTLSADVGILSPIGEILSLVWEMPPIVKTLSADHEGILSPIGEILSLN